MFLTLNHQKLDIYNVSRLLVIECYRLTKQLPSDEKFGMVAQIRRAALSVHLNIAEGASRRSDLERRRFYEISRGSLIEIDAALDIAQNLQYLNSITIKPLEELMIRCFQMLAALIKQKH
ncbi:MAG TPA: four helix bundle protein [Flavisolibacter sp.]|jgi:four helix bundle protein